MSISIRAAKYKEVLAGIRARWAHTLGAQMGAFNAVDIHIEKAHKAREAYLKAESVRKSANKDYLGNLKDMADRIDEHEASMREGVRECEV